MIHPFNFGDYVCDEGTNMVMKVTGIVYRRDDAVLVECTYWLNGDHKVVSLPVWRLTKVST